MVHLPLFLSFIGAKEDPLLKTYQILKIATLNSVNLKTAIS